MPTQDDRETEDELDRKELEKFIFDRLPITGPTKDALSVLFRNAITVESFLLLTADEFREMGVQMGPRLQFLKVIAQEMSLRQQQSLTARSDLYDNHQSISSRPDLDSAVPRLNFLSLQQTTAAAVAVPPVPNPSGNHDEVRSFAPTNSSVSSQQSTVAAAVSLANSNHHEVRSFVPSEYTGVSVNGSATISENETWISGSNGEQNRVPNLQPGRSNLGGAANSAQIHQSSSNNNNFPRSRHQPDSATSIDHLIVNNRDRDSANENDHQENNKSVFIGELKDEANKLFHAGDHHRALELYSRALSVDPQPNIETHSALLSNRSACHLLLQQPEKALEDAEACLRLRPGWIKGHLRKIKALKDLGRTEDSMKAVVEAHQHVGADPQLLELAREIHRFHEKKIDDTRPRLDSDIGRLIARGDVDAIKARLSADDARDVLLSVDDDGDNCLGIACYAHASVSVLQLLIDRSEELGILVDVLSSTDNRGRGCLLNGCGRNLHRQSLEVVLNVLGKAGLLKNVLNVSTDPNPLHAACANNLNVDSLIGLLNAYSVHSPLTPERAVVALGYAALNASMTQNAFHVLLRETARISIAAKQPLLFTSRFDRGQSLLHILAKNNRADLLRIFIPFFESFDQFNVSLTTPDQFNKLVTSDAYATSAAVRDLLTTESFFVLRKKYKLIYGRHPHDLKDPLENTNTRIPWLQQLFPGEPLDEPTVNLLVNNEIDEETVFDLTETDMKDFPFRIRSTLIRYIKLKHPSNPNV